MILFYVSLKAVTLEKRRKKVKEKKILTSVKVRKECFAQTDTWSNDTIVTKSSKGLSIKLKIIP